MSEKRGAARVLVVGAGICGLAAAGFLKQSGRSVLVVERAAALDAAPGMQLHSNALKVLGSLGLDAGLIRQGVVLQRARLLGASGKALSEVSFQGEIARGLLTVGVHHDRVVAALRGKLGEGEVRLGLTVSSMNVGPDHVDAYFSDGGHERFALVVGADGARSRVRELLVGPRAARHCGAVCWRSVVPRPAALRPDEAGELLGVGARVGWVPLGDGQVYAYFTLAAPRQDEAQLRGLDAAGVRGHFESLGGPVGELLAALPPGPLPFEPIEDLWVDGWYRGRIVLLGDAAHAMTPDLAQGSAMALEDAKALQFCLDQGASMADGLAAYQALRQGRVRAIHDASFDAGKVHQWTSAAAVSFRNLLYRVMPAGASRARLRALIDGGTQERDFLSHRPDLPPLSEASLRLVRFLVKLSQLDGRFDDDERGFIQASLREQGEHVGLDQLEALSRELHRAPLSEVLAPFVGGDAATHERLLELGYLVALANGRVAPRERQALAEVCRVFGLPPEALARVIAAADG